MASSGVKLAENPPLFNGDKSKWEGFVDALGTYLMAYDTSFYTDKKMILKTASYLRSEDGSACASADWFHNWKQQNLPTITSWPNPTLPLVAPQTVGAPNPAYSAAPYTFSAFMSELQEAFEDKNKKALSLNKLMTLQQGRSDFQDFISQFELLAELAGYRPSATANTEYDRTLIELLKGAVDNNITKNMFVGSTPVPGTYLLWKAALTQIDTNLKSQKIMNAAHHTPSHKPAFHTPAPKPSNAHKMPTPGNPVAMDVDRSKASGKPFLCYNCGKEGHMKRDCPSPPKKINVRNLVA